MERQQNRSVKVYGTVAPSMRTNPSKLGNMSTALEVYPGPATKSKNQTKCSCVTQYKKKGI